MGLMLREVITLLKTIQILTIKALRGIPISLLERGEVELKTIQLRPKIMVLVVKYIEVFLAADII